MTRLKLWLILDICFIILLVGEILYVKHELNHYYDEQIQAKQRCDDCPEWLRDSPQKRCQDC